MKLEAYVTGNASSLPACHVRAGSRGQAWVAESAPSAVPHVGLLYLLPQLFCCAAVAEFAAG